MDTLQDLRHPRRRQRPSSRRIRRRDARLRLRRRRPPAVAAGSRGGDNRRVPRQTRNHPATRPARASRLVRQPARRIHKPRSPRVRLGPRPALRKTNRSSSGDTLDVPVIRQVKVREDLPRQEAIDAAMEQVCPACETGNEALLDKYEPGKTRRHRRHVRLDARARNRRYARGNPSRRLDARQRSRRHPAPSARPPWTYPAA